LANTQALFVASRISVMLIYRFQSRVSFMIDWNTCWIHAFEQHRQLVPEMLPNAALGKFQYLTVT
jgi:hypothetical protein